MRNPVLELVATEKPKHFRVINHGCVTAITLSTVDTDRSEVAVQYSVGVNADTSKLSTA